MLGVQIGVGLAHGYARNRLSGRCRTAQVLLSNASLASMENGQPVPRVVVFCLRSFDELGGRQQRSHEYVIVNRPVFSRVDLPVANAYPLVAAHAFNYYREICL